MVCALRILFVIVVTISVLANVHVECKRRKNKQRGLQRDSPSVDGAAQIGKDNRRHTSKVSGECIDCGDPLEDSSLKNQRNLPLNKGKGFKTGRKRKERLTTKNKPSSSSSSVSFSNYFSNFWKSKDSHKSESPKKIAKKTGDTKTQATVEKQKPSPNVTPKGESFLNHFSGFWKSKDSHQSESPKKIAKKTGDTKTQATVEKQKPSPNVTPKGESFLNHFSGFWKDSESGTKKNKPSASETSRISKKGSEVNDDDRNIKKSRTSEKVKLKGKKQRNDKKKNIDENKLTRKATTKGKTQTNKDDKNINKDERSKNGKSKGKSVTDDEEKKRKGEKSEDESFLNFFSSYWKDDESGSKKIIHSAHDSSKEVSVKVAKKEKSSKKDKSTKLESVVKSGPQKSNEDRKGKKSKVENTHRKDSNDNPENDNSSKEMKSKGKKARMKAKASEDNKNEKKPSESTTIQKKERSRTKDKDKNIENNDTLKKVKNKRKKSRKKDNRYRKKPSELKSDKAKKHLENDNKDENKKDCMKSRNRDKKEDVKSPGINTNNSDKKSQVPKSVIIKEDKPDGKEIVSNLKKDEGAKSKPNESMRKKGKKRKNKNKSKKANKKEESSSVLSKDHNDTKQIDGKKSSLKGGESNEDDKLNENSKSTEVNFQGLKSKLNSKRKEKKQIHDEKNSELTSTNSNKSHIRLMTKNEGEFSKPSLQNETEESREETIVKQTDESKNYSGKSKGQVAVDLTEKKELATDLTDQTLIIRNSGKSEKLSYDQLLSRAERTFKRKDKRIMRKLSVLNQTTKKRFNQFVHMNESHFDEKFPNVTFNYSQANQKQLHTQKISSADLKKMIMSLNLNSGNENANDRVMLLKPKNSNLSISSLHEENMIYEIPQSDDPNYKGMRHHRFSSVKNDFEDRAHDYFNSLKKERRRRRKKEKKRIRSNSMIVKKKGKPEEKSLVEKKNGRIQRKDEKRKKKQRSKLQVKKSKKATRGKVKPFQKLKERNENRLGNKTIHEENAESKKLNKRKRKRKKDKHPNKSERKPKDYEPEFSAKTSVNAQPLNSLQVETVDKMINDVPKVPREKTKKRKRKGQKEKRINKSQSKLEVDEKDLSPKSAVSHQSSHSNKNEKAHKIQGQDDEMKKTKRRRKKEKGLKRSHKKPKGGKVESISKSELNLRSLNLENDYKGYAPSRNPSKHSFRKGGRNARSHSGQKTSPKRQSPRRRRYRTDRQQSDIVTPKAKFPRTSKRVRENFRSWPRSKSHRYRQVMLGYRSKSKDDYIYSPITRRYHPKDSHARTTGRSRLVRYKQRNGRFKQNRNLENIPQPQSRKQRFRSKGSSRERKRIHKKGKKSRSHLTKGRSLGRYSNEDKDLMKNKAKSKGEDHHYQRDRVSGYEDYRTGRQSRRYSHDDYDEYRYDYYDDSRRVENENKDYDYDEDDYYTDEDNADQDGYSRGGQDSRRFDYRGDFRHEDDHLKEDIDTRGYSVEDDYNRSERGGKSIRDPRRYEDFSDEDEYLENNGGGDRQEDLRGDIGYSQGSRDTRRYRNEEDAYEDDYMNSRRRWERPPRRYRVRASRRYSTGRRRVYSNSRPINRNRNRQSYRYDTRDDDRDQYYPQYPDSAYHSHEYGTRDHSRPAYHRRGRYRGDFDRYNGYNDDRERAREELRGPQRSRANRRRRHKSRSYSRNHSKAKDLKGAALENERENVATSISKDNRDFVTTDQVSKGRDISRLSSGRQRQYQDNFNSYSERRYREEQKRRRQFAYERKLQLQKASPVVGQKLQRIKYHLQGVLRHYTNALEKSEMLYSEIFNGTRYDIMSGLGGIYKNLYAANDDIYDAVTGASQSTRSVFMKAHKDREAQIKGITKDEPDIDLNGARTMVKDRDFRQVLLKVQMENRKLAKDMRHLKSLKMRCMQGKAQLQQVREHFKDRYDHKIVLDLFNNMRSSIDYINGGLAVTYGLGQFRRDKSYVGYVKQEIDTAKNAIRNSKEAVRNGVRKYMENNALFRRWEREKKMRHRNRAQRDGTGTHVDTIQFNRLKQYVSRAQRHSIALNRTTYFIQRTLGQPIQMAKRAVQRKHIKPVPIDHDSFLPQLKDNVKAMFLVLEGLRVYVKNQPKIVISKRCKDTIEGSGYDDENSDDDLECVEEGSGKMTGGDPDGDGGDDFIFEENGEEKPKPNKADPMGAFGVQLSEFSSLLLSKSKNIYGAAQDVIIDLKTKFRVTGSNSSLTGKYLILEKDIESNFITLKTDKEETKSRLEKISQTMESLKEIDLDELLSKAAKAIKIAKEKAKKEETTVVIKRENKSTDEEEEDKKEEEEGKDLTTEEGKGVPETKVDGDNSFNHPELFKKGKDIQSNREDIKYLQSLAINAYSKSCDKMNKIHTNISTLMQKVEQARSMLNSLQLSVSKNDDSAIPITIPAGHDVTSSSVTTMSVCIKPKTLDGTVLYVQGNQSASYTLTLDGGELTATVYDSNNDDMESLSMSKYLEENQWYTIRIIRTGQTLSMTVKGQDDEIQQDSVQVDDMPLLQPSLIKSFIGGVPENSEISGDPWQGCVGELTLNGQSLSVFQPALDGQQPSLCSDHCISQGKMMSWSFDGDGFVHYTRPPREITESISINFKTLQSTGSILSAINKRRRFNLLVSIDKGAVKVEASNQVENAVLLSINGSLNDGKVHKLEIKFISGKTYPELDGEKSAFSVERSRPKLYRDIKDGVLLGSFVSENNEYLHQRHRPLIGCVGKLTINGNPILSPDASEVYHAYYGQCTMTSAWQSCAHFTTSSVPLSLGSIEDSNLFTIRVSKNAMGPLLLYGKEDRYEILLTITNTSVNILNDGSETVLLKTEDEEEVVNVFTLITVQDDGKNVKISGYGQSTSISYAGWFTASDTSSPHIISLGQPQGDEQPFTGSISQLVTGQRLYDLTTYRIPNKLESCRRPLRPITLTTEVIQESKSFCS